MWYIFFWWKKISQLYGDWGLEESTNLPSFLKFVPCFIVIVILLVLYSYNYIVYSYIVGVPFLSSLSKRDPAQAWRFQQNRVCIHCLSSCKMLTVSRNTLCAGKIMYYIIFTKNSLEKTSNIIHMAYIYIYIYIYIWKRITPQIIELWYFIEYTTH